MGHRLPRFVHSPIDAVSNGIPQEKATFTKNVGRPADSGATVDDSAVWLDVSVDRALDHFLPEEENSQPVGGADRGTEGPTNLSFPILARSRLSTRIIVELPRAEEAPLVACISAPTEPELPAAANVDAALGLILSWVAAAGIAAMAFLAQAPTVVPRHGVPTAQSSPAPTSLTLTLPRR